MMQLGDNLKSVHTGRTEKEIPIFLKKKDFKAGKDTRCHNMNSDSCGEPLQDAK